MSFKPWARALYAVIGLGSALNGVWMLVAPENWFRNIPGVTDTGPLNLHLVRDFGVCFLLLGAIVTWALAQGRFPHGVHLCTLLFFSLHAAIHLWELLTGHASHQHWAIDFPGVFLPVVILLILSFPFARHRAPSG